MIVLITLVSFICFVAASVLSAETYFGPDVIKLAGDIYEIHHSHKNPYGAFFYGMKKCATVALDNNYQYFYLLDYAGNVGIHHTFVPQVQTTIHGENVSTTFGSTGYYKEKRGDYHCAFLIKPVYEEEEGWGTPYNAQAVYDEADEELSRMRAQERRKQKDRETGIIVGGVVSILVIIGILCF